MKSVGQNPTKFELEIMIKEADANGDDAIDFPEFVAVFMRFLGKRNALPKLDHFNDLFDDDNYLSAQKLQKEMEKFGVPLKLEELQQLIIEADVDQDGKINKKGDN
jgi:calmodulin